MPAFANMWAALKSAYVGVVVASVAAAGAQNAAPDDRAVARFLGALQRGVARDDRAAVAALVRYPLTVFVGSLRIPVADAATLLEQYDLVFSPELKRVISEAAVAVRARSAPASPVSIDGHTIVIGTDAVRIEPIGGSLRITRISVPAASPPSPTGTAGRAVRAGNGERRLLLGVGRIRRAGALSRGEREVYVLSATKNQLLEIRINGVSGREVVARILNAKSGAAVDARANEGTRTWIGRIPEDGDYRIEVARQRTGALEPVQYSIEINKR